MQMMRLRVSEYMIRNWEWDDDGDNGGGGGDDDDGDGGDDDVMSQDLLSAQNR